MRNLIDLVALHESVDFHPAVSEVRDGHTYIGYPEGAEVQQEIACRACDGAGSEDGYKCYNCDGKGSEMVWTKTCPNLNVANQNAKAIAAALGQDDEDYSGYIEPMVCRTILNQLKSFKASGHQFVQRDTVSSEDVPGSPDYNNPPFGVPIPIILDHKATFVIEKLMKCAAKGDWAMFHRVMQREVTTALDARSYSKITGWAKEIISKAPESLDVRPREGMESYQLGISAQQVAHYLDRLIEIFEYAVEHNCGVSWA